jgi:hypothetical protein
MKPFALIFWIHCFGVSVNLLSPACFLNPSNSKGLDEPFSSSRSEDLSDFHGIKIRIVEMLPYAKELDGVPVPKPVLDQVIGPVRILVTGYIRISSSRT